VVVPCRVSRPPTAPSYAYDPAGNLHTTTSPAGGITTSTWDDENRRTRVVLPSGIRNTFTYNGDGQRVVKQDSTGTMNFVWDGQAYLMEYTDSDQTVYTQEPAQYGGVISQARASFSDFIWTPAYYLHDALGSTFELVDAVWNPTDLYLYKAFGETLAALGATRNPFRWVGSLGYYADLDLTDYYLRARSYRPAIGRFLSVDPIDFAAGDANLYRYVVNSASQFVDPSGMQPARWLEFRLNILHWQFGSYTTDQYNRDLEEARKIFKPCCIWIRTGRFNQVNQNDTQKTLGQPPSVDPRDRVMKEAMRRRGPAAAGEITAHYVPRIDRVAAGVSIREYESTAIARVGRTGRPRQRWVLAHELAHVLGLFHEEDVRKGNLDIKNLMVNPSGPTFGRYPGLQKRWEDFRRTYKGPPDLDLEVANFVYDVTVDSIELRQDQCDRMRALGVKFGVLRPR
jgi:RHS repeat-associated protein